MVFIIMGVAGCGKTTIGSMLAQKLGWKYLEGDSFHPQENIDKMKSGVPLNDDDRQGWLQLIRDEIIKAKINNENLVISCSALKEAYRRILKDKDDDLYFVYLKGSYDQILERMEKRVDHYMKPSMLKSQFDTLEEPLTEFTVDIKFSPDDIVNKILFNFGSEIESL